MATGTATVITCRNVSVRVPGRELVTGLDLEAGAGDIVAVLGQNGSGKTLALHTLAGLRAPETGEIRVRGELPRSLGRRRFARQVALLPQDAEDAFPATVEETVLTGRHPHIGTFGWESPADRRLARAALAEVSLGNFQERDVRTLSGGERRRVAIAQVLAQAPTLYLLDEPTNHLDPQHQLEVLQLFRDRAQAGATVIVSLHDVNLAARFASHCLLLYGDGRWSLGPVGDVLDAARLSELYGTAITAVPWEGGLLYTPAWR